MRIDEVELRVIRLPYRTPWITSYGVTSEKVAVLAFVRSDGVEGYGEGVMEPLPLFREETIAGALDLLRNALVPGLLGGPDLETPDDLGDRWVHLRANPMAKATLELAVWDCWARQRGEPLGRLIGGSRSAIEVGASLGIEEPAAMVETVGRHLAEGYRRIKLKVKPGADLATLDAVRAAHPDAPLSVDANSAYSLADLDHLKAFDEFDLRYIEQPLHWDDLTDHAVLAAELRTPVCLDESLTSLDRVRAALDLGSCSVVSMKVGRVGGLSTARRIHDLCVARAVPLWCGGMLETGIGRAHNIHLATLPGFTLPGDTASASRTYARDIVNEPLEADAGMMPVPPGPGIGVSLDMAVLDQITDLRETFR